MKHIHTSGAMRMASRQAGDGGGLGLAIAQWMVQAHRGTTKVATDAAHLTSALVRRP